MNSCTSLNAVMVMAQHTYFAVIPEHICESNLCLAFHWRFQIGESRLQFSDRASNIHTTVTEWFVFLYWTTLPERKPFQFTIAQRLYCSLQWHGRSQSAFLCTSSTNHTVRFWSPNKASSPKHAPDRSTASWFWCGMEANDPILSAAFDTKTPNFPLYTKYACSPISPCRMTTESGSTSSGSKLLISPSSVAGCKPRKSGTPNTSSSLSMIIWQNCL